MKTSQFFSAAALLGSAAAQNAYIWTIDAGTALHQTTQPSSISSYTASSILARRRGLDSDRYLDSVDEAALFDINQFGGYQTPLFASDTDKAPEKILIRLSGFSGAGSQFSAAPSLSVKDATINLVDFATDTSESNCEYTIPVWSQDKAQIIYSYPSEGKCMTSHEITNTDTIASIMKHIPTPKELSTGINKLVQHLHHLSSNSNVESTILILPQTSQLKKAKSIRRTTDIEEPMEFSSSMSALTSKLPPPAISASNTSHPLPHNIPLCFTSQDICTNTTNSCSGHGSCYKAHAGCFKCRCGTTTVREDRNGGKKTVQWGGNACQKKDVSVPFVLFASIGLLLATLIAGGVGMIYGMGAQELPSVLGAGVSGPRAQK